MPPAITGALYPAVAIKNAEVMLNFGAQPLSFPPLEGYTPLHLAPPKDKVSASSAMEEPAPVPSGGAGAPIALILEPSRDLAEQTETFVQVVRGVWTVS